MKIKEVLKVLDELNDDKCHIFIPSMIKCLVGYIGHLESFILDTHCDEEWVINELRNEYEDDYNE